MWILELPCQSFLVFLVCSHGQWLKRLQKILQWFLRWWFQSEAKSFHVQRKLYNRPSLSRYSSGDWRRFGLVVRNESQTQTSWINIRKTNHRTWPTPFARFFRHSKLIYIYICNNAFSCEERLKWLSPTMRSGFTSSPSEECAQKELQPGSRRNAATTSITVEGTWHGEASSPGSVKTRFQSILYQSIHLAT